MPLHGATSGLYRIQKLPDSLSNAIGWLDELEPGAVRHDILIHIADSTVGHAPLDDHRSAAQGQPYVVQRIELEGKPRFHLNAPQPDLPDCHRLENHDLAVEVTQDRNALRFPFLVGHSRRTISVAALGLNSF